MRILISLVLSLALLCPNAYAQDDDKSVDDFRILYIDLTQVVVTALTLGFSFSVYQTFIRNSK